MRELVDLAAVERWFGLLALLVPILGVGIGAVLQFRARRPGALRTGILIGLLGPANWLLWRIFNVRRRFIESLMHCKGDMCLYGWEIWTWWIHTILDWT